MAVAAAVLDGELGLAYDAAVLWSALGARLLRAPDSLLHHYDQALGYFAEAKRLQGAERPPLWAATAAWSAATWALLAPETAVEQLREAREALAHVTPDEGTQRIVLGVWVDLLREEVSVEAPDAAALR